MPYIRFPRGKDSKKMKGGTLSVGLRAITCRSNVMQAIFAVSHLPPLTTSLNTSLPTHSKTTKNMLFQGLGINGYPQIENWCIYSHFVNQPHALAPLLRGTWKHYGVSIPQIRIPNRDTHQHISLSRKRGSDTAECSKSQVSLLFWCRRSASRRVTIVFPLLFILY